MHSELKDNTYQARVERFLAAARALWESGEHQTTLRFLRELEGTLDQDMADPDELTRELVWTRETIRRLRAQYERWDFSKAMVKEDVARASWWMFRNKREAITKQRDAIDTLSGSMLFGFGEADKAIAQARLASMRDLLDWYEQHDPKSDRMDEAGMDAPSFELRPSQVSQPDPRPSSPSG